MRLLLSALCAFACVANAAPPVPPAPSFDLQGIPLSQLVQLYFREVSSGPFVICADVLEDMRPVAIRASAGQLDRVMVGTVLESYGFEAKRDPAGVTYVCKKGDKVQDAPEPFVYRPKARSAAYLVDISAPLVQGVFANRRSAALSMSVSPDKAGTSAPLPASMASSMAPSTSDEMLIFSGPAKEVQKLQTLLAQLDVAPAQVLVRGYLYEVGKSANDASAVSMVLSLLKSHVQLSIAGDVLSNAVTLNAGGLDLVASVLNTDSRFNVVTSPSALVRSGGSARWQVGQDVPNVGAIVTNPNGQATQSVNMLSSGVILQVSANVHAESTDVDLVQTVSDFVASDNGIKGASTLNKRELSTSLSVPDGHLLVIGGLQQSNRSGSSSRLPFFGWKVANRDTDRSSELVLVLEVRKL